MNQIYVILGAPFWRAAGKKIGLWYAHGAISRSLQIAVKLAHIVFTSTEQGMKIETLKRKIVGQGIDTGLFNLATREPSEILRLITVGRISQSKNIETLLRACSELKVNAIPFHFDIIGSATTPGEEMYAQKVKQLSLNLGIEENVTWVGAVVQSSLPKYLQSADIFIHDGSTDSLDKALLEAVLCGCVVISSNPAYQGITEKLAPALLFRPHDWSELFSILKWLHSQSQGERRQIMEPVCSFVHNSYNIFNLISGIVMKY
jgi:glycosyltransferase involved in cell wall biosynthesis